MIGESAAELLVPAARLATALPDPLDRDVAALVPCVAALVHPAGDDLAATRTGRLS